MGLRRAGYLTAMHGYDPAAWAGYFTAVTGAACYLARFRTPPKPRHLGHLALDKPS
jgi:hypothetical protein